MFFMKDILSEPVPSFVKGKVNVEMGEGMHIFNFLEGFVVKL